MMASVTGSPRKASASALIFESTMAEISSGVYSLPSISTATPLPFFTILYGLISRSRSTSLSVNLRPIKRLMP